MIALIEYLELLYVGLLLPLGLLFILLFGGISRCYGLRLRLDQSTLYYGCGLTTVAMGLLLAMSIIYIRAPIECGYRPQVNKKYRLPSVGIVIYVLILEVELVLLWIIIGGGYVSSMLLLLIGGLLLVDYVFLLCTEISYIIL